MVFSDTTVWILTHEITASIVFCPFTMFIWKRNILKFSFTAIKTEMFHIIKFNSQYNVNTCRIMLCAKRMKYFMNKIQYSHSKTRINDLMLTINGKIFFILVDIECIHLTHLKGIRAIVSVLRVIKSAFKFKSSFSVPRLS